MVELCLLLFVCLENEAKLTVYLILYLGQGLHLS